jgi:UDP-GlcNAc:undecaprenyl-phosphate GlcNAc-1-phosphate transferase
LLWIALLCSTTAAGGVISMIYQQAEYALLSIIIVVFVMVFGRLFGVAEVELVSNKAYSLGKSLVRRGKKTSEDSIQQSTVQLQGNRNWKQVWDELCEFADDHNLSQITFDLNLPWLHESFHAKRRWTDAPQGENKEWYCEIPLIVDGRIFGRVEIIANVDGVSHQDIITNLLKLTHDIEPALKSKASMTADAVPESIQASEAIVDADVNLSAVNGADSQEVDV